MYLRCRPPSNARELNVRSSSFSSLAIQHRPRRRYSQQPQCRILRKRERRQRPGQSITSRRLSQSTSSPHNAPYNTAIIGGGITGLTAAYTISKDPNAKVTLYESSSRLGGWMKETERVKVDGGDMLFEYGPRSFRSAGPEGTFSTCNLLLDLGLKDEILYTTKKDVAAQNRYVYHGYGLLRIPTSFTPSPLKVIMETLSRPVFRDLLWQFIKDRFGYKSIAPKRGEDTSVSEFLSRRVSPSSVDNLFSGLVHGVYAGDIDKLSLKAVTYHYWFLDQHFPSLVGGDIRLRGGNMKSSILKGEDHEAIVLAVEDRAQRKEPARVEEILLMTQNVNSFVLKGGMVQLVDRLAKALEEAENVEVKTDVQIEKISGSFKSPMEVRLTDGSSQEFDHVISTTSAHQLAKHIQGSSDVHSSPANDTVRELNSGSNYAVNVMVVNLYFDKPDIIPEKGFGYLVPRSAPLSQNPERALGVLFSTETESGQNTASGTKLTVMMGGHWWDGWQEGDLPDEQKAIEMARNILKRHLGVTDIPSASGARLQRNAIPQPTVGHYDRMAELDGALRRNYGDKLKLGGSWYTGVSINDCIRTGSLLGLRLRHREEDGSSGTGLGSFSAQGGLHGRSGPMKRVHNMKFWGSMLLHEHGISLPPDDVKPVDQKGEKE